MPKPVKLIALLKKKPGMTQVQFRERWVEQHAGTAELWWDSLEDMKADFDSPEALVGGRDTDSFTVVRVHLVTEEFLLR